MNDDPVGVDPVGVSFADAPVSFGEHKALTQDDSSKWTPRELLIYLLREIDNERMNPDGLVVCFHQHEGDGMRTGMRRAKTTCMQAVALMEIVKHDLLEGL